MAKRRLDYPVGYIRTLLEHYEELAEGRWPFSTDETIPTKRHSFRSPYENAIIAKADLDTAIDSLGYIEKEVVIKLDIEGCPIIDLEVKYEGLDIWRIERRAIQNMAAYLNGECVFGRWCRENGLSSHGNICEPNYLPEEIYQYMKDICLDYCVLDECPE